ncbi:MAG: SpoIIE family protein phosphatase [Cyanobacteriota bacterium]|nr:SpoIIE family protein phosphatase [Cyanobacteriota bacterium]
MTSHLNSNSKVCRATRTHMSESLISPELISLARYPDPALQISKEGIILYANQPAHHLLQTWGATIGERCPVDFLRSILQPLETGSALPNLEVFTQDNVYLFTFSTSADTLNIDAYAANITDLKRSQEDIKKTLDQLHHQLLIEGQIRAKAQADLQQEKQRFRLLFQQSPIGIAITGSNAQILRCNPAYERLVGYTEAELIQKSFQEITHPDYRQQTELYYRELLSGKRDSFFLEKQYLHKDGRPIWVEVIGFVGRNPEGEILHGFAITEDITQRRQADEERERSLLMEKDLLRYERDIQIARQIQSDFLPESLPHPEGWEVAARFSPARNVAGDFYDVFELSRGRIGLVIADVCDKGVGAALFMALFRSLIRSLSQQNYSLSLLDVLSDDHPGGSSTAGRRKRLLPSAGTQALVNAMTLTNDYIANTHSRSNMFATIFFGILDPATGIIFYINGGHEPLFHISASGEIKERLNATGPALGVLPGVTFEIEQIQLEPGDILLAYTDGVTDAHNLDHELFTRHQLVSLVSQPIGSASQLLDMIDTSVRQHIGEAEQFDDITMLAVHYLPNPQ